MLSSKNVIECVSAGYNFPFLNYGSRLAFPRSTCFAPPDLPYLRNALNRVFHPVLSRARLVSAYMREDVGLKDKGVAYEGLTKSAQIP